MNQSLRVHGVKTYAKICRLHDTSWPGESFELQPQIKQLEKKLVADIAADRCMGRSCVAPFAAGISSWDHVNPLNSELK